MAVAGVGVDLVEVARFTAMLARTPGVVDRLFTAGEVATAGTGPAAAARLAARFAAKEALSKALGAPVGLHWHDAEVVTEPSGRPTLRVSGTVAAVAAALGVRRWHVSLSHDGGLATAVVVAET